MLQIDGECGNEFIYNEICAQIRTRTRTKNSEKKGEILAERVVGEMVSIF